MTIKEMDELIEGLKPIRIEITRRLPPKGEIGVIYKNGGEEYVYAEGEWLKIRDWGIDVAER